MPNPAKAQGFELVPASEPIIGLQVKLTPIYKTARGPRLGRPIAAKVKEITPDMAFIQLLETRWKWLTASDGKLAMDYGPDFKFTPGNEV